MSSAPETAQKKRGRPRKSNGASANAEPTAAAPAKKAKPSLKKDGTPRNKPGPKKGSLKKESKPRPKDEDDNESTTRSSISHDEAPSASPYETKRVHVQEYEEYQSEDIHISREELIDTRFQQALKTFIISQDITEPKQDLAKTKDILLGPLKMSLRWCDCHRFLENEWKRWVYASFFVAWLGSPDEEKTKLGKPILPTLLSLSLPESTLGFFARCEFILDALKHEPGYEYIEEVDEALGTLRVRYAMVVTLRSCFDALWRQMEMGAEVYDRGEEIRSAAWVMWRIFWECALPTYLNAPTVVCSQLAIMRIAFNSRIVGFAAAADDDDFKPALLEDEDKVLSEEERQRGSVSDVSAVSVYLLGQVYQDSIPLRFRKHFLRGYYFESQTYALEILNALDEPYTKLCLDSDRAFDDRTPFVYRMEAEHYLRDVQSDNCALKLNRIIAKYEDQLFSTETRDLIASCAANATDLIESRVESLVVDFASHVPTGVSDFGGTVALYSFFFDVLIERETPGLQKLSEEDRLMFLNCNELHRALFALAAHALSRFSPILDYPQALEVCKVDALDIFKAARLVLDQCGTSLPTVIQRSLRQVIQDTVMRRGWRSSSRALASLDSLLEKLKRTGSDSVDESDKSSVFKGDEYFLVTARSVAQNMAVDTGAKVGLLTTRSGRASIRAALRLLNRVIGDARIMRNRNLRSIVMCCLYASAKYRKMHHITFETLIKGVAGFLTEDESVDEFQMDLTMVEIEIDSLKSGSSEASTRKQARNRIERVNVIEFYNFTFLYEITDYAEECLKQDEEILTGEGLAKYAEFVKVDEPVPRPGFSQLSTVRMNTRTLGLPATFQTRVSVSTGAGVDYNVHT